MSCRLTAVFGGGDVAQRLIVQLAYAQHLALPGLEAPVVRQFRGRKISADHAFMARYDNDLVGDSLLAITREMPCELGRVDRRNVTHQQSSRTCKMRILRNLSSSSGGADRLTRASPKLALASHFQAAVVATAHAWWAWARRVRSPGREIRCGWVLKVL